MQAIKLTKTSRERFQVSAIIVKGNRVLGYGINSRKTNPNSSSWCKSVHAEHQAMINAGLNDLEGSTMYVARTLRDGNPAIAKPCSSCQKLLKRAGVKKVYFTEKSFPFFGVDEV